jgi:hypothetical protein
MTDISDRQPDIFDNLAHMTFWEVTLGLLREAAYFIRGDGIRTRLCCDWCVFQHHDYMSYSKLAQIASAA